MFTISFAWQQLLEDVGDYQHRVDMLVVLICERIAFFVWIHLGHDPNCLQQDEWNHKEFDFTALVAIAEILDITLVDCCFNEISLLLRSSMKA